MGVVQSRVQAVREEVRRLHHTGRRVRGRRAVPRLVRRGREGARRASSRRPEQEQGVRRAGRGPARRRDPKRSAHGVRIAGRVREATGGARPEQVAHTGAQVAERVPRAAEGGAARRPVQPWRERSVLWLGEPRLVVLSEARAPHPGLLARVPAVQERPEAPRRKRQRPHARVRR